MASTVKNGIDRLRKGNQRLRRRCLRFPILMLMGNGEAIYSTSSSPS